MINLYVYTDAAIGKHGGGVGVVIRGCVVGHKRDALLMRMRLPLPPQVSQLNAELYGIMTALMTAADVVKSAGIKLSEKSHLRVYTDSSAAAWAIRNVEKVRDRRAKIMIGKIVPMVMALPGDKDPLDAVVVLSTKAKNLDELDERHRQIMVEAHTLSREARTLFKGLLTR